MTITLYTHPMSRGRIARWMLHEVGADYEQKLVAYGDEMRGAEFRAINAMGKVPTLVHDGKVITETAAICAYLAECFPDAKLTPNEDERAAYHRWMFFAAGPMEQAVTARAMGWSTEDPQKQGMLGYGDYQRMLSAFSSHMESTPYVAGERFTAADVYVGSQVIWGTQFGTFPSSTCFIDYVARLTMRPAYKAAKDIDDNLIAVQESQA